mmetsp:Transcript_93363/g.273337  ORF Transcript_93363/g.273337 Transcript_93363/m.273337 type:complete len:336 (+) Transcript_93363:488-1495(+)
MAPTATRPTGTATPRRPASIRSTGSEAEALPPEGSRSAAETAAHVAQRTKGMNDPSKIEVWMSLARSTPKRATTTGTVWPKLMRLMKTGSAHAGPLGCSHVQSAKARRCATAARVVPPALPTTVVKMSATKPPTSATVRSVFTCSTTRVQAQKENRPMATLGMAQPITYGMPLSTERISPALTTCAVITTNISVAKAAEHSMEQPPPREQRVTVSTEHSGGSSTAASVKPGSVARAAFCFTIDRNVASAYAKAVNARKAHDTKSPVVAGKKPMGVVRLGRARKPPPIDVPAMMATPSNTVRPSPLEVVDVAGEPVAEPVAPGCGWRMRRACCPLS